MLILSIDCAGEGCAVCLWRDGRVIRSDEKRSMEQDASPFSMVQDLLQDVGATFETLDLIAVSKGPGNDTALKKGLSIARSLGLATKVPVVGIDRFLIYRTQYADVERDVLIVLDSRAGAFYAQECRHGKPPSDAKILTAKDVVKWCKKRENGLIIGDCAEVLASFPIAPSFFAPARHVESVTMSDLASKADRNDPQCAPDPFCFKYPYITVRNDS